MKSLFFSLFRRAFILIFFVSALCFTGQVSAEGQKPSTDKEPITPEAVQSVQKTLKDKKARQEVLKESKAAKETDRKAAELAGSEENKEKMYEISADVLANYQGKSPEELQKIMDEAAKNPEKFYNSLTPEQKSKIKELSGQIEATKKRP